MSSSGTTYRPASTDDAANLVRDAAAPLRIVGAGGWLAGGGPFAEAPPLETRAMAGVVDYTPGDLVCTVRAGTTLAELDAIARAEGQMLAVAPYGTDDATIGSVVATATAAPLAFGDQTIRDLVLGLTVVSGEGTVLRVGGRVVKNVAGFDLVRLTTGAWGTLGVITEVTVRLHAVPDVDDVVGGVVDRPLDELLPPLLAQTAPLPMQLVLDGDAAPMLWARLSGNAARAHALMTRLDALGLRSSETSAVVHTRLARLRDVPSTHDILRARGARSDALPLLRATRATFPAARLAYDPQRGALRITGADIADLAGTLPDVTRAAGAQHPVAVVVAQGRRLAPARSILESRIKQAFDPRDLLNRLVTHADQR